MNEQEEMPRSARSRFSSVISMRPRPLDIKRPPPWNKWFHKAIHYWRYGYSHPDEDLLGVIEATGDVLHVQAMAAKAVLTGARAAQAAAIEAELEEELDKPLPDFSTLLGIESRINALYPPAMARRRQWVIRDRFERVAPPAAFQTWQMAQLGTEAEAAAGAGEAPAAEGAADDAGAETGGGGGGDAGDAGNGGGGNGGGGNGGGGGGDRSAVSAAEADSQALLSYIHANYLMTIGREKAVRDLKRWLLMRFWLFLMCLVPALFLVWIVLWFNDMGEYWGLLLGLFLIATVGRAGATTSIIRRLQSAISQNVLAADPIVELTALRTGKNEISMALLSSSIFALLMWAFFASGIPDMLGFEGGLFPSAIAGQQAEQSPAAGAPDRPRAEPEAAAGEVVPPEAADDNSAASAAAAPAAGKDAAPPEPAPAPAAAPATTAAPAAPAAEASSIRPDLTARARGTLEQAEAEVLGFERAYRTQMARLSAAGGIGNWFERRRLRHDARTAAANAVMVQQQVVAFFEAGQLDARHDGNTEAERRWSADLNEAEAKRASLDGLQSQIDGDAKPTPSVTCPENKVCNPFRPLATALRLNDESDFFKMLLWAFIAGFAERFVPDMLDRVVSRARPAGADSDAALAAQVRAGMPPPAPPPPPPLRADAGEEDGPGP